MRSGVRITHSPTTRSPRAQALDVAADLDHLAHPFVARRHGIGDRDDVVARPAVRNPNGRCRHGASGSSPHCRRSTGDLHVGDDRLVRLVENQRFHRRSPSGSAYATVSMRPLLAEAKTASSKAMLLTRCVGGDRIGFPRLARRGQRPRDCPSPVRPGGISTVVIGPPAMAEVTIQPSGASTCALSRMSIQPFEPKTAKREMKGLASEAET